MLNSVHLSLLVLGLQCFNSKLISDAKCVTLEGSTTDSRCWEQPWKGGGTNFTCSGSTMSAVPAVIPLQTVNLILSGNNITTLRDDDFQGCSNIVLLDLSYNSRIVEIHPEAFSPLTNLRTLTMVNCMRDPMILHTGLFNRLLNLQSLAIQKNFVDASVSYTSLGFLDTVPLGIDSLELDIPSDLSVISQFLKFRELKKLGLYFKDDFPLHIANETLQELSNLSIEVFRLQSHNLTEVEHMAFTWFPHLRELDLSDSNGIGVDDLHLAWYGLQNSSIRVLNLDSFGKRNRSNYINLDSSFSQYFNFSSLTEINLESSRIESASFWQFAERAKKLQRLNLSFNHFYYTDILKLLNNLQNLKYLERLDISQQKPRLAINTIIVITDTIEISSILPPSLSTLDLSGILLWNKAFMRSVSFNFPNSFHLTSFDFSRNLVDRIENPFIIKSNTNKAIDINLSENVLYTIEFLSKSVKSGLIVESLQLRENKLVLQHDGALPEAMFQEYIHLEELDLSSNEMKLIPEKAFSKQKRLRILILSGNYLTLIKFEFSHMHNLTILDLGNNLLTQLNEGTRSTIDALRVRSPNLKLNMYGNPIECSCNSLSFIRWIYDRQDMIEDFITYTCIYDNHMVKFRELKEHLKELEFQCSMNLAAKISAGLLSLMICITGFAVLLYWRRWDIRFICIKFVHKRNLYERLEESKKEYEYDAFVAYHGDNLDWVRDELYQNMDLQFDENNRLQNRFRLCIHHRDFLPGSSIEDNIVRAIENSRKTILVLSESFLTSDWCQFEFQMARMESDDKGRNLIIAVMLEPLPTEKISKSLRMLIRKNTYIEWFDDPIQKEIFWEKLRAALKPDCDDD